LDFVDADAGEEVKWWSIFMRLLKAIVEFLLTFIVMTVVCALVWGGVIAERLYDCTDSGWLEYLSPGHWVHQPVAVQQVVHGRSMTEPDTIRQGWNVAGLWCLWCSFIGASLLVSILVACKPLVPKWRIEQIYERT
jgi:hypothetical protein